MDEKELAGQFRQPMMLAHKPVKGFGVVVALCKGHKVRKTSLLGKKFFVDTTVFNPWWVTAGCTCENCTRRRRAV